MKYVVAKLHSKQRFEFRWYTQIRVGVRLMLTRLGGSTSYKMTGESVGVQQALVRLD